jgi:tetratricopeptide (TPR) repeat protein
VAIDDPTLLQAIDNLGLAYFRLGNPDKAIEWHSRLVADLEAAAGAPPESVAWVYHHLGGSYLEKDELDPAMSSLKKGMEIICSRPPSMLKFAIVFSLGEACERLAKSPSSSSNFRDWPSHTILLCAIDYYEQALDVSRALRALFLERVAISLERVAMRAIQRCSFYVSIAETQGRLSSARESDDHLGVAESLMQLGHAHMESYQRDLLDSFSASYQRDLLDSFSARSVTADGKRRRAGIALPCKPMQKLLDAEAAFGEAAEVFALLKELPSRSEALFLQGRVSLVLVRDCRYSRNNRQDVNHTVDDPDREETEYAERAVACLEAALDIARRLDIRALVEAILTPLGEARSLLKNPPG